MTHAEAKPSLYRNVRIHQSARLSPAAGIVGDVTIGRDSCVLAGAQIRADDAPVIIGDEVNIQENAVVHVDHDHPAILHDHCTIGPVSYTHLQSGLPPADLDQRSGRSGARHRQR